MESGLTIVPFNRYGSYLALSYMASSGDGLEGLYLRKVHGNVQNRILRGLKSWKMGFQRHLPFMLHQCVCVLNPKPMLAW